jgi:hypothetical protein
MPSTRLAAATVSSAPIGRSAPRGAGPPSTLPRLIPSGVPSGTVAGPATAIPAIEPAKAPTIHLFIFTTTLPDGRQRAAGLQARLIAQAGLVGFCTIHARRVYRLLIKRPPRLARVPPVLNVNFPDDENCDQKSIGVAGVTYFVTSRRISRAIRSLVVVLLLWPRPRWFSFDPCCHNEVTGFPYLRA